MDTEKVHSTVGCCGLDCGLCPRYWTSGTSKCPGCAGQEFSQKHPSCSFITCCVKKNGLETCAGCPRYPCKKFDGEGKVDSFVTHRHVFATLDAIVNSGMDAYIEQQGRRMAILQALLERYDEGRSKSFYCVATTLLSLASLEEALSTADRANHGVEDKNRRAKTARDILAVLATREGTDLKLKKKPG